MSDKIVISQIVGFSYKSYDNYSGPDTNFKQSNIIYGANGNGKSSLAKGLEDECKVRLKESEYAAFNSKYIKENLYIEDRKTLKGVKISVGKENVSTLAEIDSISKLLSVKEKLLKNNEKLLTTLILELGENIDNIFDISKGSAKIKKKSFIPDNPNKTVEMWVSDYEDARNQFPDFDFSKSYSGKTIGENLENIAYYNIPQFPKCPQISDYLEDTLMKTYDTVSESKEILNWLEEGLKLHNHTSKCAFCGSDFNSEARFNEIHKILQNECKSAMDYLSNFSKQLRNYIQAIKNYRIDNLLLLSDEGFNAIYNDLKNFSKGEMKYVAELCEIIDKKAANMSSHQSFVGLTKNSISVSEIADSLQDRKLQIIKRLNSENEKESVLVKGIIGFGIKNSALIKKLLGQISDKIKMNRSLTKDINEKKNEVDKLKDSISEIKYFADAANDIINFLGLDIRIAIAKNNDYVIKKSNGGTIVDFDSISEGERNLIAFLFFYLSICPDQKEINPEICVIIIDDAVSSLDSNNKTYLLVLINALLENKNSQNFVFTHCWEDYINLAYGKKDNPQYSFFECVKIDGKSGICTCKIKDTIYSTFFKEIYLLSQKSVDLITDHEAIHAPNTMRRILESYLRFNYNVDLATDKQRANILSIFYSGETTTLSSKDQAKLSTLLKIINIQSHGSAFPITPQKSEVSAAAKYLVKIFEEHDKNHYVKMKE